METLVHLDISNNQLDENEFWILKEALEENHSCFGFHNEGNFGITDEKMFLVKPMVEVKKIKRSILDLLGDVDPLLQTQESERTR